MSRNAVVRGTKRIENEKSFRQSARAHGDKQPEGSTKVTTTKRVRVTESMRRQKQT